MNKVFAVLGRLCGGIGILLLVGIILVLLPLSLPRLAGYEIYEVISGSMEPAIPTYSVVYVQPCQPALLQPGEVITYQNDAALPVVHRVQQNDANAGELITKGDANAQQDILSVPYRSVLGKVAFHLPLLGLVAQLLASASGRLYAFGFVAAAALFQLAGAGLRHLGAKEKST